MRELRKLEQSAERARKSAKLEVPIDSLLDEPASTPDFFTALAAADEFLTRLAELPEQAREIVELTMRHRMTAPEISRSTGLSVDSVRSIRQRAIAALRRSVSPDK